MCIIKYVLNQNNLKKCKKYVNADNACSDNLQIKKI